MANIHLWQEELKITSEHIYASVAIENSHQSKFNLWYRFPVEYYQDFNNSCDSFVIATIFLAMSQGYNLIVHGQVSPSLLDNLEEFQAIWSCWRPKVYSRINIQADQEKECLNMIKKKKAISAFSGGVDSCFTAFRHHRGICGRQKFNLQSGLMVHGFDIPIEEEVFTKAAHKSQAILSSLSLKLIQVATNFRQVIKLEWEDVFGAAIASCFHLFTKGYTTGIIPSSYSYRTTTFPYGSNAITDPFLSSDSLKIIYDGAVATRFEKIQTLLSWSEALENLRVCWQGEHKDQNCCRCDKCIRNILIFRALGYGLPACFEQDVSNEQISQLRVKGSALDALQATARAIKTVSPEESWTRTLNRCIQRNLIWEYLENILPRKWKKLLSQLKQKI